MSNGMFNPAVIKFHPKQVDRNNVRRPARVEPNTYPERASQITCRDRNGRPRMLHRPCGQIGIVRKDRRMRRQRSSPAPLMSLFNRHWRVFR